MAEDFFVHESACVDEGAEIGAGTHIWHFCHVMPGARLGQGCNLGQNVYVGRGVVIGEGCKIQNNVSVYENVFLDDHVFCGPSMVFTNVLTPRAHVERKDEFAPTRVGKGATLGANCTIVCGHDIGAYATVGAGAVVSKTVKPHALMVGVPAHQIGWVCRCGERLSFNGDEARCERCGDRYREDSSDLRRIL